MLTPAEQIHAALTTLASATAEHRAHGERLTAELASHRATTVGLEMSLRSAATAMHAADRARLRNPTQAEGDRRALCDGAPGSRAPSTASRTASSVALYCPTSAAKSAPPVLRVAFLRRIFGALT